MLFILYSQIAAQQGQYFNHKLFGGHSDVRTAIAQVNT